LDKIKKRLIEYLAVVRLNELAREAEEAREKEQELSPPISKLEATGESGKQSPENMQLVISKQSGTVPPALMQQRRKRKPVKGPILLYVLNRTFLLVVFTHFVAPASLDLPAQGKPHWDNQSQGH